MKYLYYVIFGETWGSGHLSRAINFKENRKNDEVEIIVEFENNTDQEIALKYTTPRSKTDLDFSSYILINDTLGMFDIDEKFIDKWVLDSLNEKSSEDTIYYHILYPHNRSKEFPFLKDVLPKKMKSVMILQGGGDDHRQIPIILNKIPENIFCWVCIGGNCRYTPLLIELINKRKNAQLLVNVPVFQILDSVDFVVTAAGNTLVEILSNISRQRISIYTREDKELITASLFNTHPSVDKVFDMTEEFKWLWND
ncbi:TPA: hypothetical protein ACGTQW_004292 [Escherichia coli]|nr:hypothetical protein [Escherichia coli]HAV7542381.1 hypothetical protein [Escherichia coli]